MLFHLSVRVNPNITILTVHVFIFASSSKSFSEQIFSRTQVLRQLDLKKRELYMFAFKTNYALCMIIMTPSKSIVVGSKKSERATKFVGVIKNQI